jgi:signal transduction histidine kinase
MTIANGKCRCLQDLCINPEQSALASGKGGFGLTGIKERAALLRGKLTIESQPRRGTTMMIEFNC